MNRKKEVLLAVLETSWAWVQVDGRMAGVALPDWLCLPSVTLQLGHGTPVPIDDLVIDDDAVSATLSFRGTPHTCRIPWEAVIAIADVEGQGVQFPDDVPIDLHRVDEAAHRLGPRAPTAPLSATNWIGAAQPYFRAMPYGLARLGPRTAVPQLRPAPTVDWSRLLFADKKGFVLSRIDGRATLGDIVLLLPFPEAETVSILEELLAWGLINIPGRPRPGPGNAGPSKPLPSLPLPAPRPALDPAVRARIEEVLLLVGEEGAGKPDPYQLLGVPRGADRKTLKGAYFKLCREFHPDRYFRRDLGEHRRALQRIFNAIQEAYQTLDAEVK